MNPKVDAYLEKVKNWKEEQELLRRICLECGLQEDFKWMHPCYTFNNKNIALIHGFKDYCALLFYKGALLKDTESILIQQTENVQSGRQIRFVSVTEILALKEVIKRYIYEAIEVEKAGVKMELKKTSEMDIPEELQMKFQESPSFENAFKELTPGRQKGYLLYFGQAKQSKTRYDRIEKYTQRIFDGKGFHDCVCGLSKKMPNCDGSHKML
jgi:uncharacterized protein YdeI (YjbR/CyaY-like superfamily)